MKLQKHGSWKRRGISLLWEAGALREVLDPSEVVSIRQFFELSQAWPEDLPGSSGAALVVAGLEGCLDVLDAGDGETWLEADLRPAILSFQQEYEQDGALIFWLPSGKRRVHMHRATEEYVWRRGGSGAHLELPLGRCLWSGAESDVARILVSDAPKPDPDGDAYVGLYHPRIS
jgi:hypothetical protein